MKVKNLLTKSGHLASEQYAITHKGIKYFQSYNSIIVIIDDNGCIKLGPYWDYSKTTGKYRNQFLGESLKETRQKLKEGIYKLDKTL